MLDLAWQVTEAKVDELVALVSDKGQDVGSRLAHGNSFRGRVSVVNTGFLLCTDFAPVAGV
jgi:hypothetical protein